MPKMQGFHVLHCVARFFLQVDFEEHVTTIRSGKQKVAGFTAGQSIYKRV